MCRQWILCEERNPVNPTNSIEEKDYLTCSENGIMTVLRWADGWNCHVDFWGNISKEHEMKNIKAWMELPKPYGEKTDECNIEELIHNIHDFVNIESFNKGIDAFLDKLVAWNDSHLFDELDSDVLISVAKDLKGELTKNGV